MLEAMARLCHSSLLKPLLMAIASESLGGYTVSQVADGLQACSARHTSPGLFPEPHWPVSLGR